MAKFFIDRPIFAWVIALFVIVVGAVAITQLPIAQYPPVAPPAIVVNVAYPGASAQTLEDSVLSVIEREMNGSPGLIYMESVAQADGTGTITITFETGTNADLAQVDVQNRLSRATPRLPAAVTQQGVRVDKSRNNFLLFTMLSSDNPAIDTTALGDYASRNVVPELQRVAGIGQAQLFGTERAMRIWIDPARLRGYNLSAADVNAAVRAQNAQVSSGTIGDLPNVPGQAIAATVVVNGQLTTTEQFGDIVLRANTDGSTVRLKDVARIELGGQGYATSARLNGQQAVGIGVQLAPSGNALASAKAIRAKMTELERFFPQGVKWSIPYDSSRFVNISITEVVKTLFEAVALVFLVMFLFLQNWRYTLIPTIVVPIALLGTFGILLALGFSINVLTMFGMVLVIGIVVDDAIVVVENVERIMSEEGLSPLEATRKAMRQISGAIIGVTVVLISVFVPLAFFAGSTGNIYRQFSAVMVASIGFSAFMALSLTPALCATLLKPVEAGHHHEKRGFFGWFNRGFTRTAKGYESLVARILKRAARYLVIYAAIIGAVVLVYRQLPTSFLPQEDQGYIIVNVQLPPGATQERMLSVMQDVEKYILKQPEVQSMVGVLGFSFSGQGQNAGLAFVTLKDWEQRHDPGQSADAVAGRAFGALSSIRDAFIYPLAAAHPRAGQRQRLQLPPAGPRRRRPRSADQRAQPASGHGKQEPAADAGAPRRAGRRAAAADRYRPRQGERARGGLRCHQQHAVDRAGLQLHQRFPEPGPPAARGGAGRCAGTHAAAGPAAAQCEQQQGRAGAALGVREHALDQRCAADGALQRLSGRSHLGLGRARLQLGRRDGRDGKARRSAAPGLRLRVDRPVARGEARGRAGNRPLRLLDPGGVPVPGRAVRELDHPAVGDPGRAAGRAGRAARDPAAGLFERRVLPSRADHHHRPVGEERDPDHRVRQGPAGAGQGRGRVGAGGRPPAVPADHHDLAGLRPRRAAAGAGLGRGLCKPARDRHRRDRRHGDRHRARRDLRAGVLRGGAQPVQGQRAPARGRQAPRPGRRHRGKPRPMIKKNFASTALAGAAAMLLAGCSLIPTYERPVAPVPASYPGAQPAATSPSPVSTLAWQDYFTDPRLAKLIETALANNRDLRVAVFNIEQARAQFQIQRAAQFPALDLSASGSRSSPNPLQAAGLGGSVASTYSVNLGITAWELDFFGRVASLKEQALAQFLATEESRKATQISLISAVASGWLTLIADDELLALTRQTLATREESQKLTRLRFDSGVVSEIDLRLADSLAESARASYAEQQRLRMQDENALALLLGAPVPPEATEGGTRGLGAVAPMAELPAGLPSDLLGERPDIRAAEQQLIAANANIGAARAPFSRAFR